MNEIAYFWFRRDLRFEDNRGLFEALRSGFPVQPVFIFDSHILERLVDKADRRVALIHEQLLHLETLLRGFGASLRVLHGKPEVVWTQLLQEPTARAIYCNEDYEPYARTRDALVEGLAKKAGIAFWSFKDSAVFAKDDVLKGDGSPYTVFTPYSRRWLDVLRPSDLINYDTHSMAARLVQRETPWGIPSLTQLGFSCVPAPTIPDLTLLNVSAYDRERDRPDWDTTSHLGTALRFGLVSIRQLVRHGQRENAVWLQQLIWRDFFMHILYHYPHVVDQPFRPKYSLIPWRNNEQEFAAWCAGCTGYPIVDAGMRQLNETGYMHNRVRMIVASFLTKHLLIDWRWGEAYFAKKLLDYDLAANNGNWQWAAGTGCDAAPYFRVFSPSLQAQKFDPQGAYVQQWVPEVFLPSYVPPIVEHAMARDRAIATFRTGLDLYERSAAPLL